MQRFACLHKQNLTVTFHGECGRDLPTEPNARLLNNEFNQPLITRGYEGLMNRLLMKQLELSSSSSDTLSESNLESGLFKSNSLID